MSDPLAYLVVMMIIIGVFVIAIVIGEYIIPALTKLVGEPKPKQRIDYAKKDWIQTLSSYRR